jgi:hypothetical protein
MPQGWPKGWGRRAKDADSFDCELILLRDERRPEEKRNEVTGRDETNDAGRGAFDLVACHGICLEPGDEGETRKKRE